MARQREFDEEKVLDALCDVFWEHGFDGTSYAQIMARTGLQKGSLYAAFGDKKSLYMKAINRYDQGAVSGAVTMLRDKKLSGEQRIGFFMDALIEDAETERGRWGCLLCNAATDMAPFDKDAESAVLASMTRLKKAIGEALKDAGANSKVELVWATYFGGRILIKAGAKKATLKHLKAQVLASLG